VSGTEIVFLGFAILSGAAGLMAVTSPLIMHCAWWLVVSLGSLVGVYMTLGAEVVALVQLLVYVGAVVVLLLFALALTRAPETRLAAAAAGIGLAVVLGGVLVVALQDRTVDVQAGQGSASAIGVAVFGGWLLPFEILSVLLLAALVAALAVSRSVDRGDDG
jgi:NADH-quinone oxidoreductase subunit J